MSEADEEDGEGEREINSDIFLNEKTEPDNVELIEFTAQQQYP